MVIQPVAGLLVAPADGGSPMMVLMVQLALIFLIFYWLLIRPQRKERERHDQMVAALQKGDEIVTAGGIVGTILRVEEDRLVIKTDKDTRLVIERSKVGRKVESTGAA